MISENQIKPDAPVVSLNNAIFATVDHMEGSDTIKLKKDKNGEHHYIPLSWVTKVDNEVHVGRAEAQIKKEWTTSFKTKRSGLSDLQATVAMKVSDKEAGKIATNEGMKNVPGVQQTDS